MEQQRLTYPLVRTSIVLDVGAYQGRFTRDLWATRGPFRVHAFEPVKEFYDALCLPPQGLASGEITAYNYGIGAKSGRFKIGVRNDSSSLFLDAPQYEMIDILSVEDVFRNLGLKELGVTLMKINIEGSEYDLLDLMLEKDLVKYVAFLQIQFHHYGPQSPLYAGVGGDGPHAARRNAIREGLKKTHDEQWCYPFVWESWARR